MIQTTQKSVYFHCNISSIYVSIMIFCLLFLFVPLMVSAIDSSQNPDDVDFIFNRIRNATPQFNVSQTVVEFQNEGMNLVATLVVPIGVRKPPIVITCNGFAEDRFYKEIPNTGGELYYERISRIFAEQGIATLRIDFRGSGESEGDFTMMSFSTQTSDVLAAINYIDQNLKRKVDKDKIGLFGHSQGGILISMVTKVDKRVKSAVMWSGPSSPPVNYSTLMTVQGIRNGLALPDGGTIVLPLHWKEYYLGDVELGKGFFVDLFKVDPVSSIRDYDGPLMYVAGRNDYIVFPQPLAGQTFMDQHEGLEKLVVLDGDHEFNSDVSYELFDDAVYWAAAWYLFTLD